MTSSILEGKQVAEGLNMMDDLYQHSVEFSQSNLQDSILTNHKH